MVKQTSQTSFLSEIPTLLEQLPVRERPAERLYQVGAQALNLTELLAAVIGGQRQLEIAQSLVARWGTSLLQVEQAELAQVPGVGRQTAARIKAALELGQRLAHWPDEERRQIRRPEDAADLLFPLIGYQEQEHFVVLYLNTQNRVVDHEVLYKGSLNSSLVRIAEVFRGAIRRNCAAIIVAHNHPSGEPNPSLEDVALTRQLVEAGKLMEVEVLDHVIIGQSRFVSLRERGMGFSD